MSPTSAAAAATPAAATSAATPTAASAATATTAANDNPGDLLAAGHVFPIEEMERGETDVGHFLFAEDEALTGQRIVRLRDISGRDRRC